jgi:hypothetical protein
MGVEYQVNLNNSVDKIERGCMRPIMDNTKMKIKKTICIPRVDKELNIDYVKSIFEKWNIGTITKINEYPLHTDYQYKRIMIDLVINTNNQTGSYVLDRFNQGENIKLVHDGPWYWKMVEAR